MRRRHSFAYNLVIFILAQLVWLAVLLLWIYWYVKNNLIFEQVGEELSPQIVVDAPSVAPFVVGIVMLAGLSFSLVLFFRHLSIQIRLTKLYDNFIANITHELKSPLSSIQLYLETLNSRDVPLEKKKEFYEFMMRDAARLQNLINSILEISALEGKQNKNNLISHQACQFIPKIIKDSALQFRLPDNNLNVESIGDCKVLIDPYSIKMVFDNLMDNAIKYNTGNLKIDVKIVCHPKIIEIDFKDNGIGIPANEQKKVFQKFYRIYDRDIPNVKGTGLGLYWVKEILKNHKGKISVHSDGKGKGTSFKIELPVYKEKKSSSKEKQKGKTNE
ncbi:MAG: HAMP domain-containing histidine kinase [Ignavibacteriaceae bacterium]|nr:HAMP domain-containing histidine kinase [Ignavibacteriaceae bacterium]